MKPLYYETISKFVREEIIGTASKGKLTNEQAADYLRISSRNYYKIKSGQNSCSLETFIAYIVNMCNDPIALLDRLSEVVKEAEEKL